MPAELKEYIKDKAAKEPEQVCLRLVRSLILNSSDKYWRFGLTVEHDLGIVRRRKLGRSWAHRQRDVHAIPRFPRLLFPVQEHSWISQPHRRPPVPETRRYVDVMGTNIWKTWTRLICRKRLEKNLPPESSSFRWENLVEPIRRLKFWISMLVTDSFSEFRVELLIFQFLFLLQLASWSTLNAKFGPRISFTTASAVSDRSTSSCWWIRRFLDRNKLSIPAEAREDFRD